MKMYILVKRSVPLGYAMVAVAHASLAAYLRFKDSPEVAAWLAGPFKKAVCKVDDAAFEAARAAGEFIVITESALDGGRGGARLQAARGVAARVQVLPAVPRMSQRRGDGLVHRRSHITFWAP